MLNRLCALRARPPAARLRLRRGRQVGSLPRAAAELSGAALAVVCLAVGSPPLRAAGDAADSRTPRPPGLVILQRSESVNGLKQIGVFGARADAQRPGLWSVQVWEETDDRVIVATDRIGCSATAPMRITGSGGQLLVRELNPGGAIHSGNRLDQLIWWAVCHPSQAGRDPASLAPEARRLGYSGQLTEQQQVLRAPAPSRQP